MFNELARIFSEDNNASAQRAVLWREGTAKVSKEFLISCKNFFNYKFPLIFISSLTLSARMIATCRKSSKSKTCSLVTARFPISERSSPTSQ